MRVFLESLRPSLSLALSLATAADQTHNGGLQFLHTLTWPSGRRTFIHGRTAPLHGGEEEVVDVCDGEIFGFLHTLINMCVRLCARSSQQCYA